MPDRDCGVKWWSGRNAVSSQSVQEATLGPK